MRVPIQIHVSLCISLRSRNFFTHRAVVATSAQCFGIGTRIHFEQLREDCVSAFSKHAPIRRASASDRIFAVKRRNFEDRGHLLDTLSSVK